MAEINDNVKKLYNSLKLEGYTDLGDIDQFDGKLKDSGARKSLYDALNRDGFTDLGEFGEFETKLGYEMPKDLVSPSNDATSSPLTSPVNAQPVTAQDNQGTQPEQEKGFWGTFAGDVIQRIYAGGQDLGAGIFGLLDKGARGLENLTGGLVKSGGAFGQIADTFERDAAISRARSNRYQGKDYKQLWDEGDYAGMIGDIALTGAESLPMSIAAAASSVVNPAAGLVGIGAITASEKYDQLDESNPNMKEFPKLANAILTGLAEGGSEMLGAGVSNAWIKGLYKTMGKEKAEQAIQQGLLGKLREHFKRFGIFYEPVEEGLEEVSSQFAQNVTDKITGASPDIDVTEGLADSFVYGMGGGAYFSAANLPAYARQRVLERRANRQAETKRQDDSFRTATNNAYEAGYNDTSREGINATYNNAQSKKANLDAIDPGLAVTIDQYVNDNASEGEVISLMEGLDGDTRAAAEEYYNSQIAMRGVYDKALDDVDKKVKEMRDSVTPYVTTTEDGRQQYTTAQYDEGLFHGKVFVKSIEGDKAIIYQDGKEKMVDARRLSDINTGDLDTEIEKLRESMIMSEQVRLDLYTQHSPKTRYPEPGLVVFNGKDAFILQGQDENGDWSAFPAVMDKETGQVTAKANGTPSILTEREILELQDNAYASQDMPVNEQVQQEQQPEQTIKTSEIEGENATSPSSGESNVSQETPQSDLDRVIASLPKKKDGSIDYKAMTPMQQYDYTSVSEGSETALADLQQDIEAKRVELSGIEDKISKATGGDRAALRDQARAKRKEYEELTAFYNSVAPAPASVETIQEEQEPSPIVETQEEPVAESVSEETTTTETAQEEPVSRTVNEEIEDLFDGSLDNDEIDQLVDANIKEAEKALGKIKKPAVGADKAAYLEKKKEYEAKREAAQAVVDHWNDVKAQIANNRAGVEQQAIPDLDEIGEPLNAHELAAEMLANGSIKLTRDSYMQETGFGDQETKGMFGLFASPEKGGVSVERAGEILTQADSEGGYNFIDPNEPNAARDVIIDVLSQAKTRGDLINYIKRRREEMANRERQAAYNDYAKWTQDNFGMTPEEWEAYNDAVDRDIRSIGITDEELMAIDGEIYDEMLAEQQDYAEIYGQLNQQQYETNQGNEQGRDQEPGEGGGEVLPTEQPVETGRDGVVEGEREAGDDVNRQDDGAQAGEERSIKDNNDGMTENQRAVYDSVVGMLEDAGIQVEVLTDDQMKDLAANNEITLEAKRKSDARKDKDRVNGFIDEAISMVTGKSVKDVRSDRLRREQERRNKAKKIYDSVLDNDFNDVTLRLINEYIDEATPNNPYGRRISQRVPQKMERRLHEGNRTNAIDALFTRISESAVGKAGEKLEGNRGSRERAKEKKKELLKGWAIATGNWHTDISDFTNDKEPVARGKDSDVYYSKDGEYVIKFSKGKEGNRFPSDIDAPNLFSYIFPNSAYEILGYGEIDGNFVTILRQPIVEIESALTEDERVEYMRSLGFYPINKDNTAFSNGDIIVADLQKGNVVRTKEGNVRVIDADVKLHTKDLGGKYSYPPVDVDTENRINLFKDNNGIIYGATIGGKIYLNGSALNPETPIHEYTHIWDEACRRNNPELWNRGVDLMRQTSVWNDVKNDPNYSNLETDDEIASEVHSRLTGKDGARILEEMVDSSNKQETSDLREKLKKWLDDFWWWLKDTMMPWTKNEVSRVTLNDFVNMPLKDLANGKRANQENNTVRFRFIGERGASNLDQAEEATTRMDNLNVARNMENAHNDKKRRIEKLRTSKPVEITGNEIEPSDDLKQYKKNALEYGKRLRGEYTNKDTGVTVMLSSGNKNGGLKEVLQHDINDIAHLKSVAAIPGILENSIYIETVENEEVEKNPNVSRYHYYVCGLKIGDTDYTVKAVVAEQNNGNRYYDHKLTEIEKGKLLDELAQLNQTSPSGLSSTGELEETEQSRPAASRGETQSSPVSQHKDTRLMSILKTNDKENARKIKMATGWERGADGKWRYETPDFSFKENPVVVPFDGYVLTNLGALINDEELFKAYPELEDMTVQYQNLPLGMLASYSPKTNRFPAMITMDNEFIRKKENPEWRKLVEKMEQEPVIKKWIEEMEREPFDEAVYNKAEKDFKESPLWEKYNDLLLGKGKVPRYVSGFSGEKILAHEIQHAIQDIEGFAKGGNTRNTQYNNFAGEVESRNVEKRFDLSPEGRSATLAEETEDVAREDQIFINNALNNNKSLLYETSTRNNQSKEAGPEANREDSRAGTETVEANGNIGAQDNTPVGSTGRETEEANDGVYNGGRVNGQQTGNYDRASDQGTGRENRPANGDIDGQDGQRPVGIDTEGGEQGQRDIDSGERNNLGNIQPGNDRGATDLGDRGTNDVDKRLDREGDGIGRTYQGRQRIIEVSNETAGALGVRITVFTDINELPDGNEKRAIANGRKVTGWYDIPSGKVYVYAPNVADENEAKRTILHETVGHKGLRQLIGERDYDAEMARLFGLLPKKERDAVADRASRRYDGDVSVAMDEYLAEKAELDEKPSWWEKAVSSVRDMLRKIGIDVRLTDNDVKYLLWRSRQGLANANATAMAEDMVMRDKLGIDPKRGGDTRFRTAGERSVHDHSNIDQYATERQVGSAKEQYERTLKTSAYKFQEAMQDSMLGLKTLMDAVEKESGKKIMDYENAYIAENAMSSKNLSEMEVSRRTVQKNMIDEITKLEKQGTTFDEISDYLIAKHGIERNRLMALKKALSKNEETYQKNMEDYIAGRDAIRANGKTWEEQQRELDELAESYGANLAEDYSGFNEMFPPADNSTEYDREAAYGYVTDYENAYDTSGVLRSVAEMNASILDKQRNSGLMSDNAYKTISDMYQYYVPLRGWEQTTADEAYTYLTTDRGVFNAPVKTAYGRRSKAANPIFNMVNMAESGIVEGNRNLMKQRFLTMAQNHKTDLVSVSDMWVKEVEVMDEDGNMVKEWQAQFPTIPDNATPEEVESIVAKFNERMEELSKDKDSKIKRSKDMGNIPYKILPREKREHQVVVKRNGKEYVLTINGNPRAAQALNGLTNPDNNKTGWYGTLERSGKWLNRHLAANYTTRNPGFVISNFLRDMIYSNSMVWVKENPLYSLRFNRNFAKVNPAKMFSLLRKYENGTLDMNNETERYFNEFMRGGGETGYTNIRDVEAIRSDIAKEMRYSNKRLSIGKAFNILGKWMDLLNRSVENNSRFAAYVTSRQEGRSVDRSVYDAKEISVNFNKKGSGSKFLGEKDMGVIGNMAAFTSGAGQSLYVFWNAGVQGVSNTAKIAKNNKLKFAGLGATYFLLGSLINVAMQELGGDDDDEAGDYYDLPEYVRRNNICIRNGVGGWITIPLPIELRAIYGLGELVAGLATGREKMSDQKVAMKVAEQFSQIMPLDMLGDGGGFMAFVPSAVKPIVEAGVNVDWTGLPIYKDNDFNKTMPEWTKAYSNVDPTLLALSKNLNEWTGGDKYTVGAVNINPAIVEHILSGYLGGFESMRAQLVKSIDTATGDREFEWRNVPVLSRVIREGDERTRMKAVNDAYYENMKMMKEIHQQELGYKREMKNPANTPIEIAEYSKKYSDLRQSDKYKAYKEIEIRNNKYLYLKDLYEKTKDERLVEHMDNMKISINEIADMIK